MCDENNQAKEIQDHPNTFHSIWSGFGNALNSVKQTTLNFMDNLQEKIISIDSEMESNNDKNLKKQKQFNPSVLPIIENATTYLNEPSDSSYQLFLRNFSKEDYQEDIDLFKIHSTGLQIIYSRLVPSSMSDQIFWARLFFVLSQNKLNSEDETKSELQDDFHNSEFTFNQTHINSGKIEEPQEEPSNHSDDINGDWGDWK